MQQYLLSVYIDETNQAERRLLGERLAEVERSQP